MWVIAPNRKLNGRKEGVLIPIKHTCIVQSELLKNAYGLPRFCYRRRARWLRVKLRFLSASRFGGLLIGPIFQMA